MVLQELSPYMPTPAPYALGLKIWGKSPLAPINLQSSFQASNETVGHSIPTERNTPIPLTHTTLVLQRSVAPTRCLPGLSEASLNSAQT